MPFNKPLPEWKAPGVEPPQDLKDEGWQPTIKPPADYFNWFFYNVYEALKELQEKGYTKDEVEQIAQNLTNSMIHKTEKGQPNGVATLNAGGKVPSSQLDVDLSDLATKEQLNNKVDKVPGKGLSTNDYTTAEKNKLAGIETGAQKNEVTSVDFNDLKMLVGNAADLDTDTKASLVAAINELEQKRVEHLAEDASITKKGHVQLSSAVTSTDETKAATSKAVKTAMDRADAAFTSASNGKQLIGTAITGVDDSLVVPTDATFQQLADLIGSISTGKKWASGSQAPVADFSIMNLDFRPSIIFVGVNADMGNNRNSFTVYDEGKIRIFHSYGTNNYYYNDFEIHENGFTARMRTAETVYPKIWWAFE